MAENQEIIRLRGDLELAKGQIADLREDTARMGVVTDRVMKEIVPGVKELTDAVAQLHSRLSVLAIKLGLIGAAIATVAGIIAQLLIVKLWGAA